MSTDSKSTLATLATTVQVLSVVAGVVISVSSFNVAREKEAKTREVEAETRRIEAMAPFRKLRQDVYVEAIKAAAVLANAEVHSKEDVAKARARFRDLYVAELTMVETKAVESQMVRLALAVDPSLAHLTPEQDAALNLAKALRDSYVTWADVEPAKPPTLAAEQAGG